MSDNSCSSTANPAGQQAGRVCESCTSFKSSPLLPDSTRATELRQILRSNVLPPSGVEASLKDVIGRAPSELARYDAEIQRIQSVLSALVSECATLEAHIQACRSVFSPVRRLPMELLGEIFGLCLPPYEESAPPKHLDSFSELRRLADYDLLRLSQVSSSWHKIALGIPRLWSTITVNTNRWLCPSTSASALSLLGIALQRSGGFPLSISASFRRDANSRAVIRLLAKHAERWQHLSCHASGETGETGHYFSSISIQTGTV
ncbi:hypothetical protein C8R47DRAFT_123707 [Mycena vitilis]|nr:hypothetical protein C8R47DRAFT_123707 [Mycena vitilis]